MAALMLPSAAAAEDLNARAAASAKADDGSLRARPVLPRQPISAPRWTVSAEALFLGRSGAGRQPLVSLVPGDVYWWTPTGPNTTNVPGVEALNSGQLGQRLAAGQKLGLAYRDPSGIGAELSYFGVLGLKVAKATGPENPGQWLVMKAPGTFWQTQDYAYQSMVWQSDTRLHSLEANARLELSPRVTLLAGVRWLQLRDRLEGTLDPADLGQPMWKFTIPSRLSDAVPVAGSPIVANPPFWTTETTNDLYGIQIGANAALWEAGRFSLDATIKAGVYDNRARQLTLVSMQKQIYPAEAASSAAAFVAEGGLVAKYRITEAAALKLGYAALWLDGVALAPGQIQQTSTTPSSVTAQGVNHRSGTLFQGMTFGVEYSF
ncbi:hypothetical protein SR870_08360 [Rhodopseudomonas palustris]|uniref:hypothetical protein n=1 Tax=Rhodopseudomonas palustris TaxID=1076 RepID=UPI002ACE76FC|nr:hypothetical protein [Rhodopseudomonas palustris]WQH01271.1 hypothetical protein SR870_08360 [Rhodopseudomonas palustris]